MNPKPDKFIPALYGGVIMAFISTVPFLNLVNCFCCAGLLFGGFIAVFFYKNNFTPDTPPFTSSDCIAVGTLAGVISAFLGTILSVLFLAMFGNIMAEFILNILRGMNLPEENMQMIEESLAGHKSFFYMILEFGQRIVLDTLFGLLGGLIGYNVFKPKGKSTPPPPMQEPPQVQPAA